MKRSNLAIIIPTLNEQAFIGKLLDSIISQSVLPKEIVVVDAHSHDKTIDEIKLRQKFLPQLKFYQIPKSTISKQRNLGVAKTKSVHILFLDADMEFKQKNVLEKYFNEVLDRKPDSAAATNLPNSRYWKDLIYFKLENTLIKASRFVWPIIPARNLYVRREIFNKVGGFDEKIAVGEDQEMVHRILKNGDNFIFLKTVSLYTSTRRMAKEGRTKYALKMMRFGLQIMVRGHRKSNVEYEFGNFKQN